jgi:two-component system OmpR family sensor kinase
MGQRVGHASAPAVVADGIPISAPEPVGVGAPAQSARSGAAAVRRRSARPARQSLRWLGAARGARVRIVGSYILLLAVSAVLLTFALRQILLFRLDTTIGEALQQEVLELDRLQADGRNPLTGRPFVSLDELFDVYFLRNVPSNEEAAFAFVDGALHTATLTRFPVDTIPPNVIADWEAFSSRLPSPSPGIEGRFSTALGEAHFRASRIWFNGEPGAFVIALLPAGELRTIAELQTFGVAASFGILTIASVVAWLIVGRALAPVRLLTETAQSISQSDLTKRIEVRGGDEAGEMAQSFNAMLDRLETVFRSQREFIEDAGHELRDPLTVCRGQLELLDEDPEERERTIALVLDEIDRMSRIVDDLQLLAEAEQPDFLRPEPIDLVPYLQQLMSKVTTMAPREWTIDEVDATTTVADRHRLTEALMNLVSNAIHHTAPDDTIALGAVTVGDQVRLSVRDTGTGISMSDQARIFSRFARGRGANRRYRGSGLGLPIVQATAEAHGGRVELESRLGLGSTFTIVLPLVSAAEGAGADDPDR